MTKAARCRFFKARGLSRFTRDAVKSQSAALRQLHHFMRIIHRIFGLATMANSLWPQKGAPLLPGFLSIMKQNYGVEITPVDFKNSGMEALAQINQWAAEQTQDKIKDLIDSPLDPRPRLVLVNAVYFKGIWENTFEPALTLQSPFFVTEGRSVQVPLMQQTGDFNYATSSDCQIIELPCKNGGISMLVILPVDKSATGLTAP